MSVKKKPNLPRSVVLELTEACNLRCKMCFYWGETGCFSTSKKGKKPAELELELIKQVVEYLTPVKPLYSLFGGEPLMYPHLEEVIRLVKSAGSFIDTPTNGTLLSQYARLLVQTEFDLVRVSIDGPLEISNSQRGKGSYERAMAGIEALYHEKQTAGKKKPFIDIIYTITPTNYHFIEEFFLNSLDVSAINSVSIQMENFITEEMGLEYAKMLKSEFGITSDTYWQGLVRSPDFFSEVDTIELSKQVNEVSIQLRKQGKSILRLPPTFSSENLAAYLQGNWKEMRDLYETCIVPWLAVDITASGDLAPCHVFFDLVMGNLHAQTFEEIWNGNNYRKFRDYMKQNKLMSICPGCCIIYLFGKKLRKKNRSM